MALSAVSGRVVAVRECGVVGRGSVGCGVGGRGAPLKFMTMVLATELYTGLGCDEFFTTTCSGPHVLPSLLEDLEQMSQPVSTVPAGDSMAWGWPHSQNASRWPLLGPSGIMRMAGIRIPT